MKNLINRLRFVSLLSLILMACTAAYGQLTPIADTYINTATPTVNYGATTLLDVKSASQTAYIQFDLSSIPAGYTGANVTKATLKLYVNAVTKAGSFNVDYVNGTWTESTLTAGNAPALGSTIAASVPLTTAEKNQYILIDITAALQAWLNGSEPNDGIALVANSPLTASFDSKESTSTSHSAELDIVFAGGGGSGITGIATASGSGLIGGGTSGTLDLSLTNACAASQVLQWNGTAWACASVGTGTITSVTAGTDLTGGGASGNVSLNLDTTKVPQLNQSNIFSGDQMVNGNLSATGVVTGSAFQIGSILFAYGNFNNSNAFLGFAGNSTMTGQGNAATGVQALQNNTTGYANIATGVQSLQNNTTGSNNDANGAGSLQQNNTGNANTGTGSGALSLNTAGSFNTAIGAGSLRTTDGGSYNTAAGYLAGQTPQGTTLNGSNDTAVGAGSEFVLTGNSPITNSTVIGSDAIVSESNAVVLGCIAGQNYCPASVNVGIGTATPAYTLDVQGTGNFTGLVTFASGQTFPGTGSITGVTAGSDLVGGGNSGNVTLNVDTTKVPQLGAANTFTANQMVNGNVTATAFNGNGSGLINVNAATVGGLAPSAFAQLTAPVNTFAGIVQAITNVVPDSSGVNSGKLLPGLLLGGSGSGEGMASNRLNGNQFGIDFYTDFISRMSITNSGKVGIGTSAPQFNLDLNSGDAIVRGADNFQKSPDTANFYLGDTSHGIQATYGGGIAINTFQKSNALFIQDGSGNVGIGTTKPAQQFEVNGSAVIDNALGIGSVPVAVFSIVQGGGKAIADGWDTYSSRRWKTNIHTLQGALDKVERLRGVSYDLKDSGKHEVGVIAEEVGAVVPEIVTWEKNGKDAQGVDYTRLTALLIEATKEQQALIRKQQHQLKTQQVQIADLSRQVKTIQTALHNSGRTDSGVLTAKASLSSTHR